MDSKQPSDERVSISDDREELLSRTEVDESLMGDEKQWGSPHLESGKRSKRKTWYTTVRSYRWLLDTLLLLVIIGLLILLRRDQWKNSPSISWQVGGDFTGASQKFPTKVVKFEADMGFAPRNLSDFFTNETLAKWNTLMPAGTGRGSTSEAFFTTSMTHQLHCVYMMARVFSAVSLNSTQHVMKDYQNHFLHCVDYLRQSIMCSADLALEAHDASDSDDLGPLDGGWSGQHVCKDYSHVVSYLEEQITDGVRTILAIDD